jgi:hypothetical protein
MSRDTATVLAVIGLLVAGLTYIAGRKTDSVVLRVIADVAASLLVLGAGAYLAWWIHSASLTWGVVRASKGHGAQVPSWSPLLTGAGILAVGLSVTAVLLLFWHESLAPVWRCVGRGIRRLSEWRSKLHLWRRIQRAAFAFVQDRPLLVESEHPAERIRDGSHALTVRNTSKPTASSVSLESPVDNERDIEALEDVAERIHALVDHKPSGLFGYSFSLAPPFEDWKWHVQQIESALCSGWGASQRVAEAQGNGLMTDLYRNLRGLVAKYTSRLNSVSNVAPTHMMGAEMRRGADLGGIAAQMAKTADEIVEAATTASKPELPVMQTRLTELRAGVDSWLTQVDLLVDAGHRFGEGEWKGTLKATDDLMESARMLAPVTETLRGDVGSLAHDHAGLGIYESWQSIRFRTELIINPNGADEKPTDDGGIMHVFRHEPAMRYVSTLQIQRSVAEFRAASRTIDLIAPVELPTDSLSGLNQLMQELWQLVVGRGREYDGLVASGGEVISEVGEDLETRLRDIRLRCLNFWTLIAVLEQEFPGEALATWRAVNAGIEETLVPMVAYTKAVALTSGLDHLEATLLDLQSIALRSRGSVTQLPPSTPETSTAATKQGS